MLQIEQVPVSEIREYEGNAKIHTEEQVKKIADSIRQFGMNQPIAIDENNVIIAGHGRFLACKSLDMEDVPCIRLAHMSEQQKKAYILADNKLNMETGFDLSALEAELQTITDFDMGDFGFDLDFSFDDDEEESDRTRDDERLRTDRSYNLDKINIDDCRGYWELPAIGRCNVVPDDLVGFNYAMNSDVSGAGIHFYIDDYQFERVWNDPDKYLPYLKAAQCVLMPDFSLYMDMPLPMKLWNVYRSRAISHYWQRNGINVIPSLTWADEKSYDYCFDGIPKGSIVAVSTVGVKNSDKAMKVWSDGMRDAIRKLRPSRILLYGGDFGFDFGDIPVTEYDNKVTTRMKESGGE